MTYSWIRQSDKLEIKMCFLFIFFIDVINEGAAAETVDLIRVNETDHTPRRTTTTTPPSCKSERTVSAPGAVHSCTTAAAVAKALVPRL